MKPGARRSLQAVGLLVALALLLPVSNLITGPPSGTPLAAVAAARDPATAKVAHALERSCASCHVAGTKTPFYAQLPVASSIVERDKEAAVRDFDLGRGFEAAASGPVPEPTLAMIEREVKEGEMPPLPFVAMHWNARLDAGERRAILDWVQDARAAQAAPGVPDALRAQLLRPLPARLEHDPARAALGRKLYHDKRLSGDDTLSCASCHDLAKGGTDNETVSDGIGGRKGGINAPTTLNAALNFAQFWDGRAPTLEAQAGGPPLNPVEMGSTGWPQIVEKLNKDRALRREFEAVYPEGFSEKTITSAIAEFERTLLTPNSRFDRFLAGDAAALDGAEMHGYATFVERGCATCHAGELLGGKSFEVMGRRADYFGARRDVVTAADDGRYNVTKDEADRHRFKVPTLRNVARTSPYFHDGSKRTLAGAVDAMATFQLGAPLPQDELRDVVRFLEALTGEYDGKAL
jgi:cytochrome c peroxidase